MWKRFWSLFIPQQLSPPMRRIHFYTYFSTKQKKISLSSCIYLKLIVIKYLFFKLIFWWASTIVVSEKSYSQRFAD